MPIRIMHVVHSLGKGGLENGLVNLVQRMDPTSFEHVVCTIRGLGPNAERLPRDRVRIVTLDTTGWRGRVQTPALVRTIKVVRPDVVHSRNWSTIEAVFAARLARVPGIVHSEHGFESGVSAMEPRRRTAVRRSAFELAHRVLAVSFQLRETHARRTGFPVGKIEVIHNGVDCVRFSPDPGIRARIRQELAIADDEHCLGCVANLLPVKDHLTLLRALELHASRTRNWRLLLVGEGPERSTLQAYLEARPDWKDRVMFLGSSARVPDLLRAMDVFVLPSVSEGICNSLLEAMATGIAAVATAVGGNVEVVDTGSGILFEAGDAATLASHLDRLQAQPGLRATLASAARERMLNAFSIESMVHDYQQLYSSLRPAAAVPALSAP